MDLPSRLDLYALARAFVQQTATRIDPSVVDVAGSDLNIIVGSGSVVADAVSKQIAYQTNRLFLDGAENEDLDRYVWDRYQITRNGAYGALVTVRIYRDSNAAGAGKVPSGTQLISLSGSVYATTQDATFGALDVSTTVFAQAVQAGKATQVGANMIQRFQRPSDLFDPSLKVNNDAAAAGGEDAEDDETLRNRVRNFWITASKGTLGAIAFGAMQVPGVVSATCIESLDPNTAAPARIVLLFIADSSGVASQALAAQVDTALSNWRAAGIDVIIYTSIPQIVPIQLALTFIANVDTVGLTNNIRAAVVAYVNSLPVNAPLTLPDLGAVLSRFRGQGLITSASSIVVPAGDVVPTLGSTLRTTLANVVSS